MIARWMGLLLAVSLTTTLLGCGDDENKSEPEVNSESEDADVESADASEEDTEVESADDEGDAETADPFGDKDSESGQCVTADDCIAEIPLEECRELVCEDGTCVEQNQTEGSVCGNDPCGDIAGVCSEDGECELSDAPLDCDDDDLCTEDDCDADVGCIHSASPDVCDDGHACTEDSCDSEEGCSHIAIDGLCDDSDLCTVDTCDVESGCINTPDADSCVDDNPCTDDTCDPTLGCTYPENEDDCDDNDVCTTVDVCSKGLCTGLAPVDCTDDNPCTFDTCDGLVGCINDTEVKEGQSCDDGEPCTLNDTCNDGICSAGSLTWTEGELECQPCSDELACAQTEDLCDVPFVCGGGYCKLEEGVTQSCDDNDPCTNDSCNPLTGDCTNEPVEEGTSCDDGDSCTENTSCQEGLCVGDKTAECIPGCAPTDSAGCEGCECEDCVCAEEPFCCEVNWDANCVKLCTEDCGQECDAVAEPVGCAEGELPTCNDPDECVFSEWLGDGFCDEVFNCEGYNFDEGDCNLCEPNCENKACGDDGCGSLCGTCADEEVCNGGICEIPCGNGSCDVNFEENCVTCAEDCGACPKSSGCETSDQPTCGGCACEACVCALDELCCTTSWDTSCVLLCINECEGCDYDSGCSENFIPEFSGTEGICSEDQTTCFSTDDCTQPEPCPTATITCESDVNGVNVCRENGVDTLLSCTVQEDCGDVNGGLVECNGEGLCQTTDTFEFLPIPCSTADECPEAEPCTEPAPNLCDGGQVPTPATIDPGCNGCACEDCVCSNHPECCSVAWDEACGVACQLECGTPCGLNECNSDIDCFDGNDCTNEFCNGLGVCAYPLGEGCCATDEECDDGNACTINSCSAINECVVNAAFDESCCPDGGTVFQTDFESSISFSIVNSVPAGGWQLSQIQSQSGSNSLWYGSTQTGNLDFGPSSGTATSTEILLPDSFTLTLKFWVWSDVFAPIDVFILLADGTPELVWKEIPSVLGTWTEIEFDLTPWKSQLVQLRFAFSSNGAPLTGVFIDDISIQSDCFYPFCGDGQCNGTENCFTCEQDCPTPGECPSNDGCNSWEFPGCVGCPCETDVCEEKPDCCDLIWDETCVLACGKTDVQNCGPEPGCVSSPEAGCKGCECESCVCDIDSWCCDISWDNTCVGLCTNECGQNCEDR